MTAPSLSIVIPAYNEALRLPPTLKRLRDYLATRPGSHEVLVVDDGSSDGTAEAARGVDCPGLEIVRTETNRGKGHAVRVGMLRARGARRLMTDADLSTPIEDLDRLLPRLAEGYDVAIGSRALSGANIEVHQPWYRENAGRVFNLLVRLLVLPGLHDTQCGFKVWSGDAAREAFSLGRLDGFCFDVEALYLARRRGRRIAEVPITWRNDAATRVGALRGMRAFLDLARIRVNDWRGLYSPTQGL
ncbi:MAG: dolichyl-phosphate beta-glucosyltransferase [Vicinamibacteria bacterium]